MKMTIVRSLTKLKLLQKKFEKEVENLKLVCVKQGTKLKSPFNYQNEDDFNKEAISQLNSITSIMNMISAIKTAIDKSNSVTIVKIGTREMTIQEALVEKKYVLLKKQLLKKLQEIKSESLARLTAAEEENQERADKYREDLCGSSRDQQKKDNIEDSINVFLESFKVSLVDPCNIDKKIEELDNQIEEFLSNVDFVLSESNSTTEIEVPD